MGAGLAHLAGGARAPPEHQKSVLDVCVFVCVRQSVCVCVCVCVRACGTCQLGKQAV